MRLLCSAKQLLYTPEGTVLQHCVEAARLLKADTSSAISLLCPSDEAAAHLAAPGTSCNLREVMGNCSA